MKRIYLRAVVLAGALAAAAVSARAEGLAEIYALGQARWGATDASGNAALLTPENLSAIKTVYGPDAAWAMTVKKDKVSGLLRRYAVCELTAEDAAAGVRYLREDFAREISYLAAGGCLAVKKTLPVNAPQSGELGRIYSLARVGSYSLAASAELFDGAKGKGSAPAPAAPGGAAYRPGPAAIPAAVTGFAAKPLASPVPPLRQAAAAAAPVPALPADLGKDGRVNQAAAYWEGVRRENWAAYSGGDLHGSQKAKAFAKAAAGSGLGGLLAISNLPRVETAAARLGWDMGRGAGSGVIAADCAKLGFNSAVFSLTLLPIPILKVSAAALAGEAWAISILGAMAAGPVNRYMLHLDED